MGGRTASSTQVVEGEIKESESTRKLTITHTRLILPGGRASFLPYDGLESLTGAMQGPELELLYDGIRRWQDVTRLKFSPPIVDEGLEYDYRYLFLITSLCANVVLSSGAINGYQWHTQLDKGSETGKSRYAFLDGGFFGEMRGSPSSYSKEARRRFEEMGPEVHRATLAKIQDLYLQLYSIPGNLFKCVFNSLSIPKTI